MDASRKRKAAAVANSPAAEAGSASKRLRLLNSTSAPTARNSVQEVGYKVVAQLRIQADKTGRVVTTQFLELPDPDELPEYYDIIKLPLALDTIEGKVKRNEYQSISNIESDLRRLVQNAKDFNDPDSQIYQDAERVRKMVFNFMKQHNPAYNDPSYSAHPTPVPKTAPAPMIVQNGTKKEKSAETAADSRHVSEKPKRAATEQSDRKSSLPPSAASGGEGEEEEHANVDLDFTGKTYQEAQQLIVVYMLNYTDDEGLEIYSPFGNLPSRKLEDYYKVIRHPVSLKSVLKRCRGIHGRAPPTGHTDFKNWDAFEDEMSFIWRNAKDYNEDASEMYKLAEDFEEHFRTLLAEAREKIDEPSSTRIKLGGPKPKVTLNLSQPRGSPAPGVSIDNEALARQRQMVQAGSNGKPTQPPVNGLLRSTSDGFRPSSSNQSASPAGSVVKAEHGSTQSPAPAAVAHSLSALPTVQGHPAMNGMMLPPAMRPTSSSPYPAQYPINNHYVAPVLLPPTQLRSYPKEAALLPAVTINSHPNLKVTTPFSMTITPHATLSQQSTTTTLPSSHYFVQIGATISKQLSMGRPYKIFVSVNGTRLTQRDTQLHPDTNKRTHVYEGSLAQGVNRLEVEVAAAKLNDEKGLDVEKVTVFANLMR